MGNINQPLNSIIMAEIKIEKKKPIWPWILVILIILAAVYFFWYKNDQKHTDNELTNNDTITKIDQSSVYMNDEDNGEDSTALYDGRYGTVYNEQAIADYLSFVDNKESNANQKDYYKTAFSKLIAATKREAEIANVAINTNISSAMTNAETDKWKMAATDVSKALKSIQQEKFDNLSSEADAVNNAVAKIEVNTKPDNKNDGLDDFLDKSASLLQKMNQQENDNQ